MRANLENVFKTIGFLDRIGVCVFLRAREKKVASRKCKLRIILGNDAKNDGCMELKKHKNKVEQIVKQ